MKYYFLALATIVVVCVGCITDGGQGFDTGPYAAPPAEMMTRPGPMVDGPGPGVLGMLAPPPVRPFATATTQVRFLSPSGMHIGWQVPTGYAENQLITPAMFDFVQGATYRLKLTNVPGRPGLVLYPTLQVYPAHPTTDAYLAHNAVPIEITDEDLDQVQANNFVTKVIYLPDPRFQELAIAGVETLVSTRLDPGIDPVSEADRRGTIMAVLRVGNMDFEAPGRRAVVPGSPFMPVIPGIGPNVPPLPHDDDSSASAINQISHQVAADGAKGQIVPPMPVAGMPAGMMHVPGSMIMGQYAVPGMPAPHPIAGMGAIPSWGMPQTGTPIGLTGPPHIPYGGPASLQSHTVRNNTDMDLGKPVEHFLVDVRHEPGLRLPHPVKHVQYEETHPIYHQGQASYPQWYGAGAMGGYGGGMVPAAQGAAMGGAYCPPGQSW